VGTRTTCGADGNLGCSLGILGGTPSPVELLPEIDDEKLRLVHASVERVTTIKPARKRSGVVQSNSRGAAIKRIEAEIANLDQWQKRAAIESPEGPQRIRGLAGSGKTVVLACS